MIIITLVGTDKLLTFELQIKHGNKSISYCLLLPTKRYIHILKYSEIYEQQHFKMIRALNSAILMHSHSTNGNWK